MQDLLMFGVEKRTRWGLIYSMKISLKGRRRLSMSKWGKEAVSSEWGRGTQLNYGARFPMHAKF